MISTLPSVYSNPAAPGFIMGTGNVGRDGVGLDDNDGCAQDLLVLLRVHVVVRGAGFGGFWLRMLRLGLSWALAASAAMITTRAGFDMGGYGVVLCSRLSIMGSSNIVTESAWMTTGCAQEARD